MVARVKFLPNDPYDKGGDLWIDVKVVLPSGDEVNIYAKENTQAWDALLSLEKEQVISVESFTISGRDGTFYRLTEEEINRLLNGEVHPANYWGGNGKTKMTKEEVAEEVLELYDFFNQALADGQIQPNPETLHKLAATTYIQYNDQ